MISVITCVNDFEEYEKNIKLDDAELIPIDNTKNKYSAAQALNLGLKKATNDFVVCCHQDVSFPEDWTKKLYINLARANFRSKNMVGILGTAGVLKNGAKRGYMQDGDYGYWNSDDKRFGPCQTVDECCMIFYKSSKLRFDEAFNDFHFYGADLCLQALHKKRINFGIDAPIIHHSGGGKSSMKSGRETFKREMLKLKKKWISKHAAIWTTAVILYPHKEVILADYMGRD